MKLPNFQWAVAIAAATTLGVLPVSAQDVPPPNPPPANDAGAPEGGPAGGRGRRGGGFGRMGMGGPQGLGIESLLGRAGQRLGITAEQKTKLEAILEESRSTNRSSHDAVRKERDELRKLTQADSVDEGAIRAQATKLATAEGDFAVQQAKTFQKVREVLTPEQLSKFKEDPRPGMRGGRDGERRGGGRDRGKRPDKGTPAPETAPTAPAAEDGDEA